ncbi:MAG: phenylalanine--tRNA ligase subunit beta [Clostridia bacterium]|jgi:phenylalanine--tRNA ligase, beta subunit|nr:phenylalanine--tRNA ligase subunit beta [Clostridia bacterium]
MKLSTNFLKDYIDIDVDVKQLAEDMTRVGNEYDSASNLINATKLVIGQITECEPHPDSDHLHLCKVNIGTEVLDIVCGAPNARTGLKVIVALDGAVLPEKTIKKGMIRGQESNGMLCSIAELGLEHKFLKPEDSEGIAELGEDAEIGGDPIKYLQMDDGVIDFELTANRGDLLSILGMAYEVGAIYDKKVKDVDLKHKESGEDINKTLKTEVKTANCSKLLVKKVENVKIEESPIFIKNRLIASGIRPINNVVDISNYVMLELGQPLHFYDADKLGNKLVVRMAEDGEKLTTLDNVERTLTSEDIVIADATHGVGLAGVMGGLETEVEPDTKNIIIESAIFDSVKVRKTSKKIVRSEASNRFEKGLDPERTTMAIERACKLLEEYAGGTVVTGTVEYDKTNNKEKEIEITFKNINDVLGTVIPNEEILNVFRKLGFSYKVNGETIKVTVPTRRLDISIKEDLIEEVSRIYGVDNIEGKLPIVPMRKGSYDKTQREIRNKMIALGLKETLTYVLINDKEVNGYTLDKFEPLKLLDPITEDRNTLRYSMIPSLYKVYEYNKAREQKDISIFEIGKGFYKKGEVYGEDTKLCVLMSGKYSTGLNNNKTVDFYVIKGIAEEVLDYLGYAGRYSFMKQEMPKEMHPGQSAMINVNGSNIGMIGKIHPSVTKDDVYVLEINLDELFTKKVGKMKYKEFSKFPSINKDIALVVDKKSVSKDIEKVIKSAGGSLLTNIEVFDVYTGVGVGIDKKSIAYSLTFSDMKKTLTDEEINGLMDKIIDAVSKKCGAELRK